MAVAVEDVNEYYSMTEQKLREYAGVGAELHRDLKAGHCA